MMKMMMKKMKNNIKIGDRVAVLDDVIEGTVIAIENTNITIETDDELIMTYNVIELVNVFKMNEIRGLFSSKTLNEVIREKKEPKRVKNIKKTKSKKENYAIELDLHIEKLIPSKKRLSNYEILTIQLEEAKRKIEFCIRKRIPRLILIHGVGEGVLKSELNFLLKKYDENLYFQEANYRKYGQGATELIFKQK